MGAEGEGADAAGKKKVVSGDEINSVVTRVVVGARGRGRVI
jgi:hypothetical protein